ncbi:type II toxin-antitoxin system ParD family antitoxin [Marivibrio halodurans]|uniref:Type II toxin-antitoxin system ParD family antitoxin n=1 Tax=Marivibrio halodurans TaxID=2039722 RepID=A0A8J7RXB1_9PROT|nr:type II toxin-antitoxin system ParD family antitoxin [Marivibrio halodurans]MBP5856250.1 type II toxin-antitoxin system ParD family antitoxin [Marivibrio halodurans]
MSERNSIERMTVTLTPEMALAVRAALDEGSYASSSEIVREALRDWQHKRRLRETELETLRGDIAAADDDRAQGRVGAFDADKIIKKGQEKSKRRAPSK